MQISINFCPDLQREDQEVLLTHHENHGIDALKRSQRQEAIMRQLARVLTIIAFGLICTSPAPYDRYEIIEGVGGQVSIMPVFKRGSNCIETPQWTSCYDLARGSRVMDREIQRDLMILQGLDKGLNR